MEQRAAELYHDLIARRPYGTIAPSWR